MIDHSPARHRLTKKARTCLVLSQILVLTACDPLSGVGTFLDCVDDDGPVLSPRELPTPVLNHSYEAVIKASIDNEPRDDNFEYVFNLGAGLPAGLIVDVFAREVRISGAPTELGNFAMRAEVTVSDPTGNQSQSRLCRHKTARNYVFMIQQGF